MIYAVQMVCKGNSAVYVQDGNSDGKYALYSTRNGYHQLICPEVGNVKDM